MTGWIWEQFQAMDVEIKDHHLWQSQRKTILFFSQKVKLEVKVKQIETEERNDPDPAHHNNQSIHITGDII